MGWQLNGLGVHRALMEQVKEIEDKIVYCNKEIEDGRYDTFKDELNRLEGKLEGLRIAIQIINV
jgi:dGTP triphosphohydrolase